MLLGSTNEEQTPLLKQNNNQGNATRMQALFSMLKSFIGLFILSLPYACYEAGYIGFIIGILCIAFLSWYAMNLLVRCAECVHHDSKDISYEIIAQEVGGVAAKHTVTGLIISTQLGFCISYLIFLGTNLTFVYSTLFQTHPYIVLMYEFHFHGFFLVVCGIILFALVIQGNDISRYYYVIIFAGIVTASSVLFIMIDSLYEIDDDSIYKVRPLNIQTFPLFFGLSVCSLEGIALVLPIKQTLKNKADFDWVLKSCLIILCIISLLLGLLGYAAFGKNVEETITLNLPKTFISGYIVLFYCLAILCSYPLQIIPVFNIIDDILDMKNLPYSIFIISRFIIIAGTVYIAISAPHFAFFANINGAIACNALMFLCPPWFYLCLYPNCERKDRLSCYGLIIFSLAAGMASLYATLSDVGE